MRGYGSVWSLLLQMPLPLDCVRPNSVLTVVTWFAKNPSKSKKLKMVALVPV